MINFDTLADAQAWLRANVDDGARCPCCTQYAKVYKRTINAQMGRALIAMHRYDKAGRTQFGWMHLPTVLDNQRADEAKLIYWGLIEDDASRRDDGGRSGWWRITDAGRLFALDDLRVPKYARVYDSRCLNLTGPMISIRDALGTRFDYHELMAA